MSCHTTNSAVEELPELEPPASAQEPHDRRNKPRLKTVALIGPPNCGKSTLFNRLTGMRQKTANYPGVTVDLQEQTWTDYTTKVATGLAVFCARIIEIA